MNYQIALPDVQTKPLNRNQKRWTIQREIYFILSQEDIRATNLPRYKLFLKKQKLRHSPQYIKLWEKSKEKDVKKLRMLSSKQFGFFTHHLDEDALWYVLSIVKDRSSRNESVLTYILSLSKGVEKSLTT